MSSNNSVFLLKEKPWTGLKTDPPILSDPFPFSDPCPILVGPNYLVEFYAKKSQK
jgi:hypothetical protein